MSGWELVAALVAFWLGGALVGWSAGSEYTLRQMRKRKGDR